MSEKLQCGICGASRPRGSCHIIVLTDAEKAQMLASGKQPEDEYIYCKPCWRVLSDRATGPSLYKGLIQARLRQLGVDNAEKIAQHHHDALVAKIKERPS